MADFKKNRDNRKRAALSAVLAMAALAGGAMLFRSLNEPSAVTPESATITAAKQVAAADQAAWSQPDAGQLGGRVTGQDDAGFVLEDTHGTSWYIATTETTPGREYAQFLKYVRVTGQKGEDGSFIAKQIQPWENKK